MSRIIGICLIACLLVACGKRAAKEHSSQLPPIYPDYVDVTVPVNIAPLNFGVKDAEHIQVQISAGSAVVIDEQGDEYIDIPVSTWHEVLNQNKGKTLMVEVSVWTPTHPEGISYKPFHIFVDDSAIDEYVAYRLLPPSFVGWNEMQIAQRNLTNFDEEPIVKNSQNEKGCMNCHNFCQGDTHKFMFFSRNKKGGLILVDGDEMTKVPNKNLFLGKLPATYPAWHPGGRYIAFSANFVQQSFYMNCVQDIEVYDYSSNLMFYDTQKKKVLSDERFCDSLNLETFPTFSPDGKYLYFCTSRIHALPYDADSMRYSIVRVPFDAKTGKLGVEVDTVYSAAKSGGSASFPRISPNGKYLLFAWAQSNTFPIHHPESDLKMIDLKTRKVMEMPQVNSPTGSESFHSWSSNSRWFVFASRREKTTTSRLYIAMFKNGKFGKSFLLPQKSPMDNTLRMYSYNVPELVKSKVKLDKDKVSRVMNE